MKKLVTAFAAMALLSAAPSARAESKSGATAQAGGSYGGGSSGHGSGGSASEQGGMGSAGTQGSESGAAGGMGTSGAGAAGMGMGQQSVEGRVLKADRSTITIEHNGAALPLTVQSSTTFQGVKSAKEIKEGQQVRASFDLKKDKNELRSVEVLGSAGAGGMGGSSGGSKSPGGGY